MARILVIDDNPAMRDMLIETLVAIGHETYGAATGMNVATLMRAHPADIVITDILMPEKDGLETIAELRSGQPQVKIIAISGDPKDWKVLNMAKKIGAHQIMSKPFTSQEIVAVVETLLKTSWANTEAR